MGKQHFQKTKKDLTVKLRSSKHFMCEIKQRKI